MRIAVTGASGHIGLNLVPELKRLGYDLRLLAHRNNRMLDRIGVPVMPGDLLDPGSLNVFLNGVDVVVHLAAVITIQKRSPRALEVNIEGTRNLLEAAREKGVKKFIHISSIHSINVFPLDKTLDETRDLNLNSPFDYDRSKAVSELMVVDAADTDFSTVVINPVAVLGPYDYQPSFLGEAIIRLYQGRIPAILNGGYHWVDVRDVAKAILSAIEKAPSGSKFMIAGHWKSLKDLAEAIEKCGGAPCPGFSIPFWLARIGAHFLNTFVSKKRGRPLFTSASLAALQHSHRDISIKNAETILNYSPRPFEESITDTIKWYRETKMIE